MYPNSQSSKPLINEYTNSTSNGTRLSPGTVADVDVDVNVRTTSVANNNAVGRGKPVAFPDGIPMPVLDNIPPVPAMRAPSVNSTVAKNKLKKARKGTGDGYESDGGYLSESGRKSKEKDKKKKSKAKGDNLDALSTDSGQRNRKRSFVDAVRGRKDKDVDFGYATDGVSQKSKKGKSKVSKDEDPNETQYETDGGLKKSKTRRFFKLSGKSSKPDLTKDWAITPPLPQLKEQMPLPIAQRFARSAENGSNPSLDETRSTASHASMPPSSLDEPRSATSLGLSQPSAGSSKSTVNEVLSPNVGNLPALSFQPLSVDAPQPSPPKPTPSQLSSSPVSFPSLQSTARDSRASSGSSSSGLSNTRSRTSTSVVSGTNSNISSSFTSPTTSYSYLQTSPRTGHNVGVDSISTTASVSQHGHAAHGYGQTQRMDSLVRPSTGSRPTSPPSSAAAAAAASGMMSFHISRDVSTVPLIMRQQQFEQIREPEPVAQILDDGQVLMQTPLVDETEQVETYPRRMSVGLPSTAPLNISKGGTLKIRPSLEKMNLLGMRKDNRGHVSGGAATPSLAPSANAAPTTLSRPPQLTTSPMAAGQHGLPVSPLHPPHLQSGRSPMSPPHGPSPGNQTLSPYPLISPPNTAIPSPANPTNPVRSIPRTTRLSNPPPPLNINQLVAPNVLAFYDIPPPSPPPIGPLPVPPQLPGDGPRASSPILPRNRSRSPIPPLPSNHNHTLDGGPSAQFPSPAQLRQRLLDRTPRKLPSDETLGGLVPPPLGPSSQLNLRRGKESPFPAAPIPQRTPAAIAMSSSGASDESADSGEGVRRRERPPRSPIMSILPGPLNSQEKSVLDSVLSRKQVKRSSWVDYGDSFVSVEGSDSEESPDSRNAEYGIRDGLDALGSVVAATKPRNFIDRPVGSGSRSAEGAYSGGGKTLARSPSSEEYVQPSNSNLPTQNRFAWDDSATLGDRTSRWSGSIYSRISIMDEDESYDIRDRFVQRVEAMLAESGGKDTTTGGRVDESERNDGMGGTARRYSRKKEEFVPPVPKIPDVFVGAKRRSDALPPGRMWNKF